MTEKNYRVYNNVRERQAEKAVKDFFFCEALKIEVQAWSRGKKGKKNLKGKSAAGTV